MLCPYKRDGRVEGASGTAAVFGIPSFFDPRKGVQRDEVPLPSVWGCSGRMQCAPTETCRDGAAERCRGPGCPQVCLNLPPGMGAQGVDGRQCARVIKALSDKLVSLLPLAYPNSQQLSVDNQPSNP